MQGSSEFPRYSTAWGRWTGLGPYYAMFPVSFADAAVREYTKVGDWVLDPFAGRGTALFSAATQGRFALGIEINPVGWLYGRAKLQTAERQAVEARLRSLGALAPHYHPQVTSLPQFFKCCFSQRVCEFLLAARDLLDWRHRQVDWTTMALILVDLHGKRQNSLSNQMRQTKAMSPQYAIQWWQNHGLLPPERDPVEFMLKKVAWRYAKGRVKVEGSRVYLGDSQSLLTRLSGSRQVTGFKPAQLLLTSPPYYAVTNYFYDQWLRMWMLGGPPSPTSLGDHRKGKFQNRARYLDLLRSVFSKSKALLAPNAVVYVRTDARQFTRFCTIQALTEAFPDKRLRCHGHSLPAFTQTSLFHPGVTSRGELDLVLW